MNQDAPPERGAAWRRFAVAAYLGAASCLVLLGVRIYFAMSFSEPMQGHTTGDEFSQFYAIWRHIQGQPVYTDRLSPPFYSAIYNWLFYESYGIFTAAAQRLLSLQDAWIPTIGRIFSLLAMVFAAGAAHIAYLKAAGEKGKSLTWICFAFAVFIVAGPLVGYWNITVRSDLWARTFEIAAIAAFLVLYPRRRWSALLVFIVFAYLAWAFKQGSVFPAGAVGLFLLARRDWRALAVLSILLPAAWAATLALGEPQYVSNVLLNELPLFFNFERMVRNLANFAVKSGPILFYLAALAAAAIAFAESIKEMWRSDAFVIGLGGALCAAVISIPGSALSGGAENYFYALSFFMGLMTTASLPMVLERGGAPARWVLSAGAIGWGTLIASVLLVLGGVTGVVDLRPQNAGYMAAKRCLDTLPRPLFVNNPYLSLPWMTPGATPYVLFYNYQDDLKVGHVFKDGGIGGLIEKGAFAAIAIGRAKGAPAPDRLDWGPLAGYTLAPADYPSNARCPQFHIFLRHRQTP